MGNSGYVESPGGDGSVHPHVHGELEFMRYDIEIDSGSSPRAWGTLCYNNYCTHWNRFIPTCMGNSPRWVEKAYNEAVHPHVHGELFYTIFAFNHSPGSSPRAWGTRFPRRDAGVPVRFIPTCMGNSTPPPGRRPPGPVHPHVHGELVIERGMYSTSDGSSPRAWGTPPSLSLTTRCFRFIPTCMGNSAFSMSAESGGTVHPHVHGELLE